MFFQIVTPTPGPSPTATAVATSVSWPSDLHAGTIQSLLLLGQVVTAVFIIFLTRRYAETAERQLKESISFRQDSFRPYVYIGGVGGSQDTGMPRLSGMQLDVTINNSGVGPALSVRSKVLHDQLAFPDIRRPIALIARDTYEKVSVGNPKSVATGPLSNILHFAVEYHDISGQWWSTRVDVEMKFYMFPGNNELYRAEEFTVLAHRQAVRRIERPTIGI